MYISLNREWQFADESGKIKTVDLPNDAMLTEKRRAACRGGKQNAYFPGGKYSYSKTLNITKDDLKKRISLFFEGVYRNAEVYVNGNFVGGHKNGYSGVEVDLTSVVKVGADDV